MKAKLILENIGSHRGIREYDLNSGMITIFEGSNSAGKSTIIKSIATALSSPINSKNLFNEANKFGILPREDNDSPIVNIFEDKATINLKYGKSDIHNILMKDGTIETDFKGNENFLYTGMLLKNSKIQEYLASGNDNFQWIVSEMSNGGKYEELKVINDAYIRLVDMQTIALKDIDKAIGATLKNNKDLEEQKKPLSDERKKVKYDIKNFDAPELKKWTEKKDIIENEIIKLNKQKTEPEKGIIEKKDSVESLRKELSNLESDNSENIPESKKIENKIIELEKENLSKLISESNSLKEQLPSFAARQEKLRVFKDINLTMLNSRLEQEICPLCLSSPIKITNITIKERLKGIEKEIVDIDKERHPIRKKIADIDKTIEEINNIQKRKKILKKLHESIRSSAEKKGNINKNINEKKNAIKALEVDLKGLNDRLAKQKKELEQTKKKIKENAELKPLEDELSEKIQKINDQIEQNKGRIEEKSQIDFLDIKIPTEKADLILKNLSVELNKIDSYLIEKIDEQRLGAGKAFNSTIKNVIEELQLDDFSKIYINLDDYRLIVVRKGGKIQPLGALGGAERGIIGGILQVSCKQTYLKEIPFFIGDDIILEFDAEKQKIFMNYLKRLAEQEDLFVIITKISNSPVLHQFEV